MSSYIELPGIGSRARRPSITSEASSSGTVRDQELGSMYDYLAKIILLGPSGTGKFVFIPFFLFTFFTFFFFLPIFWFWFLIPFFLTGHASSTAS